MRLDREHHRPIAGDSPQAEASKLIARAYQTMIWGPVSCGAAATRRAARFLPSSVGAFDDLDAAEALELISRAPDPDWAGRLSKAKITAALTRARRKDVDGSLLTSQIPIRTWADWDDARPGFVEIDLVGHDGGTAAGEFCFTLTVTDIATGWTVNRSAHNKAQRWVLEALEHAMAQFPFPISGIDSDNVGEFINIHLLRYCEQHRITFTRSQNDGCHAGQKNWPRVRELVGYHRYDTPAELTKLNARLRRERSCPPPVQTRSTGRCRALTARLPSDL